VPVLQNLNSGDLHGQSAAAQLRGTVGDELMEPDWSWEICWYSDDAHTHVAVSDY